MTASPNRRTRIIALTVLVAVVAPLSVVAARWQWSRHLEREARNQQITVAAAAAPRSLAELTDPDQPPATAAEWRQVRVVGSFEAGSSRLWRRQSVEGQTGYIALAVLETTAGDEVLVARGFIPASDPNPAATSVLPKGQVTILGRLRGLVEAIVTDPTDLPAGQTNSPGTMLRPGMPRAYVEVIEVTPGQDLVFLPPPEIESGPHLGYVGQWILIGISSIVAYVLIIRRTA